ncbi:uncharacterized protein si:ch211-214j8.12 isoform X2 [Clupea harengus]|uniref:Uncharacterized protein si:ch211-214j8.12 isoform X2 n=1 Tax=Clupea harengus TaxID=7950 RepID=A0A6P8FRR4_CLUHA|nr:uncharacterized protein si:ch211-214j8.12 isoform X2 [Clupea harengus]
MPKTTWISISSDTSWDLSASYGLLSLDLSGAVSISAPVLRELLGSLASLRSLCLAGSLCDGRVLEALPVQCPLLRHLDVTRCLHLSPVCLLSLTPSHPHSPGLPLLRSLLAVDIGFGECDEDRRATAAFLLLSLPWLERVALEALGEAFALLLDGAFHEVEDFIRRTGMPDFRDLWAERANGCSGNTVPGMEKVEEESFSLSEVTDSCLWTQDSEDEDEGESNGTDGVCHDLTGEMTLENTRDNETLKAQQGGSFKDVRLRLRQVQGVSFGTLGALGQLCPDLAALTLDYREEEETVSGAHMARELARWSASLRSLTLRFSGPLSEMAHGVGSVGANLTSLTLEGVRADGLDPFLRLLHSCPKLTTLTIHMEPPRMHQAQEEEEEDEEEEREEDLEALPCLPRLSCLALNFLFDERQKRTPMSWRSLKGGLWALLRGAPLLERVSLVAIPCPLDPVFCLLLDHPAVPMKAAQSPALQHLQDLNLAHSDVSMATLSRLVVMDSGLFTLDLSGCWAVTLHDVHCLQSVARKRHQKLHIIWT